MRSSMGRPLRPPDLLMRSTAICTPTSAVLPPAAAVPERGCSVPTLYALAWPKASLHHAGTVTVAPKAPAAAADSPRKRRRVVFPLYQNPSAWAHFSSFQLSAMVSSLLAVVRVAARPRLPKPRGKLGRFSERLLQCGPATRRSSGRP